MGSVTDDSHDSARLRHNLTLQMWREKMTKHDTVEFLSFGLGFQLNKQAPLQRPLESNMLKAKRGHKEPEFEILHSRLQRHDVLKDHMNSLCGAVL